VSGVVKLLFTRPDVVNGPSGCRAETSGANRIGKLGGSVFDAPGGRTAEFAHQPFRAR
jgi:hypothetical protein